MCCCCYFYYYILTVNRPMRVFVVSFQSPTLDSRQLELIALAEMHALKNQQMFSGLDSDILHLGTFHCT